MSTIDSFNRKLDDKNRLSIPVEVRPEFENGEVVLTRGFGKYLHMYTKAVWDAEVEPQLTGAILDEKVADLNVRFRRGRVIIEMDAKQGRVTIDQSLLDYAGIDREVEAVRAGKYWRIAAPDLVE